MRPPIDRRATAEYAPPIVSAPTIDSLLPRTRAVAVGSALTGVVALASAGAALLQARALNAPSVRAIDLHAVAVADRAAVASSVAVVAAALITLALWALWAHRAYALAASVGLSKLPMTAARAAWGFVLPVAQLWLPFSALSGLTQALDAARIPAAPPRAASTESAGHYRDNAAEPTQKDAVLPGVPLGAAWALWWGAWALSYTATFAHARARSVADLRTSLWIDLCSQLALALGAWLLARVALGLHARLRERAERFVAA